MTRILHCLFAVCFVATGFLSNGLAAEEEPLVSRLPGPYAQFAWGDGGRYVAFHWEAEKKVLVYSLAEDRPQLSFEIPEVPAGDLLAAGAEKLVIVSPSKMMIRRWDLKSRKREKLAILAGNDPPQQAVLGSAGTGPLLIVGRQQSQLFDLESLKPLKLNGKAIPGMGRHDLSVQVSPDGQTFGTIPVGLGPVGYAAWHVQGDQLDTVSFGGTSNAIRWAQPCANGYLLMLPDGELFNGNGRAIQADWLKGSTLIPTPDPRYVLDVRLDQKLPQGKTLGKVTICSTADCKPIDFEMGFEELLPARINSGHDVRGALQLGSQWRVQYVPSLNRIFTLPAGNDRIVSRSWDLQQKLKQEKREFLYLESVPPLSVEPGETLEYHIQVRSSDKKVRISLEDGPDGAKLTRKNQLKWAVPADYAEPWARFLLTISGADGQEIFHSFEVAVRRPAGKS